MVCGRCVGEEEEERDCVLLGCREDCVLLEVQTRGKKEMELLFIFTRGKHRNKISFGGTEDFIGGVGRSPRLQY